jgi:PAS domain-containing protein
VGSIFDREIHRARTDRQSVTFEAHHLLRPEWVEVRAYPSVVGLTIYVRDITRRRKIEVERDRLLACDQVAHAEAKAERTRLQAALDQMPEGVVLNDASGCIRFDSQAALALSVGETGGWTSMASRSSTISGGHPGSHFR